MDKDSKKPVENNTTVKPEHKREQVSATVEPVATLEKPKRNFLKIGIIILIAIVVIGGGISVLRSVSNSGSSGPAPTATPFLPPADPNIVVELIPLDPGKKVDLRISKIPQDITSVEYELKYKTTDKTEGVFGTAQVENAAVTREITLGTCSSGVCKYHSIPSGKGMLTIKFNSTKGATRFQKEFKLF